MSYKIIKKNNSNKKIFKKKRRSPFLPKGVRYVDYKNIELLEKFINIHGKILPGRVTGLSAAQQRSVSTAIKRARIMALLPFCKERVRR